MDSNNVKETQPIKRKNKKLNGQKIFCVISIGFLLGCILFYGNRFLTLYNDNKKEEKETQNTLATEIKNNNYKEDYFSNISGDYYFINNSKNNYLKYSNIIWRIIKINKNNELVLISENVLGNLAYGKNVNDFSTSSINIWLNSNDDDNTGILEQNLNNVNNYLVKTSTCIDEFNEIKNSACKKSYDKSYIGILSLNDYINTGATESYVNNEKNYYLVNSNKDNKIWYVNSNGKLDSSDGEDIYGIKAVITLNSNVEKISGNGTKDKPYTIEKENGLFGSYVKLDNDIWQIYSINNDETINLVLNNYLKKNNEEITYSYSSSGYEYNPKGNRDLAYYLNNTYLYNLTYKNLINTSNWNNGYYGTDNNFEYTALFQNKVNSKVGLLSLDSIILNNSLSDYPLMTGVAKNSNLIYTLNNNGSMYSSNNTTKNYIVPTININKNLLITGDGSINNPYGVE